MEKITDYKQIKVGSFILFDNKKERCVLKVNAIKTSIFSDGVDIECSIGKLETFIMDSDIKAGHVYFTKSKKPYYKKLK